MSAAAGLHRRFGQREGECTCPADCDCRNASRDERGVMRPLAPGDELHGFCGGWLGRDRWGSVVEAAGRDWIVAREIDGTRLDFACGGESLRALAWYRDNPPGGWDACGHGES